MEAADLNETNGNFYCIDIDSENLLTCPTVDVEQGQDEISEDSSHALIQREFEHGKGNYYYCTTCDKSYLTIEDYIETHEINAQAAEEAICDIIEYDAAEDETSSKLEDGDSEMNDELIKPEPDDVVETSANKYFCYDCRTVFKELEDAEQHDCAGIKQDNDESVESIVTVAPDDDAFLEFTCAFCEVSFQDLATLEQHQTQCNYIKKTVASPKQNEKYECSSCHEIFLSARALTMHNRSHHENIDWVKKETTCHICSTTFKTNSRLKLHMKIHKEQPLRTIQEALPEVAKREYNRLNHFFCEICNKSFDENLLAVHKNMHQSVEKYICEICNRHFDSAQNYEIHQQRHKASDGNPSIRTGPTDAMLRNAKNGIRSVHVPHAKQTYPCQYCGHVFWRPFEKTRHERVHTGEKPYPCEICGKRFRVPYSLTLHLRTHADVRPFVCATCNKRFKSHSAYTHHLRTHLNNPTLYSCDMCEKTFRTSVQLYAHKNSHTKPFNCTICNRPFASLHSVKLHMKSHDKNTVPANSQHRCEICGAIYVRTIFLRAHLREHHGIEMASTSSRNETTLVDESADESEADAVAALLITAAADAEARAEQRHRQEAQFQNFTKCESIENDEDDSSAEQEEYLKNELILDSFDTEETVVTGF